MPHQLALLLLTPLSQVSVGTLISSDTVDVDTFPEKSGVFLDNCQLKDPSPHASDLRLAEKLWRLSEELVREKFEF